jgi:hypothetical protein
MTPWLAVLLVGFTPGANRNAGAAIKQRVDLIELMAARFFSR